MITSHDPFSYAQSFNAMRHPYKSGSAFEGHQPKRNPWIIPAIGFALVVIAVAALGNING